MSNGHMMYSGHGQYDMDETLVQIQSLIGGLVTQMDQPPTVGLQSGYARTGSAPGWCENAVVPTHCMRTVSQRSLSTPNTFLSDVVSIALGADMFDALVTYADGALTGATAIGTPIRFNDANVQGQRARVDELVLIGMRAKVALWLVSNQAADQFNMGPAVQAAKDMVKDYVNIRVFHTSDQPGEPWIDFTPLRYFDRPEGEFVAVPPVIWKDRDPVMDISVRNADFGDAAGNQPSFNTLGQTLVGQLSILVESLFVPDPDYCGDYWPGLMCPKTAVKNHGAYKGK